MSSDAQQSNESGQLKVISKILGYSLVSTTLEKGRALYERGKASNPYVARTLGVVEQGVAVAVTTATPYVSKYDVQIRKLDVAACEKLDTIEKQVPEWTKLSASELSKRVLEEGRSGAQQVYDAKLKTRVDGARQHANAKYATLLDTIDTYVEYYLPEGKPNAEANGDANHTEKPATTERSVRTLTTKVTERVSRLATRQLGTVRSRSLESLERARSFGGVLLAGARTTYDELAAAVRVEFESEKHEATPTSNGESKSTQQPATPAYGDLQRRLHDSVLLGRAFSKVGTRYAVSILGDATRRARDTDFATYASGAIKVLPFYVPQIRVGIRIDGSNTSTHAAPNSSSSGCNGTGTAHELENMQRQPTDETQSTSD